MHTKENIITSMCFLCCAVLTQEHMWHKKCDKKRDLNLDSTVFKIKEGIIQISINTNTWNINASETECFLVSCNTWVSLTFIKQNCFYGLLNYSLQYNTLCCFWDWFGKGSSHYFKNCQCLCRFLWPFCWGFQKMFQMCAKYTNLLCFFFSLLLEDLLSEGLFKKLPLVGASLSKDSVNCHFSYPLSSSGVHCLLILS